MVAAEGDLTAGSGGAEVRGSRGGRANSVRSEGEPRGRGCTVVRMTERARSPASVLAALAVAGEDGDEGDGGGAADEQGGDEVGELEGDVVGVGGGAGAEGVGDVLIADEADHAGEEGEGAEEESGGGGGVAGGRGGERRGGQGRGRGGGPLRWRLGRRVGLGVMVGA